MEGLYGWVRNIAGYFLFLAVLDNLIPGKGYQKYIRLFAGVVVILLVLEPFVGGMRLEERIARFYETRIFQYQAQDLQKEILGMENRRLEGIIKQYETAVAEDIRQMAEDMGFRVYGCQAEIEKREEERFGEVRAIWMKVGTKDGELGEEQKRGEGIEPIAVAVETSGEGELWEEQDWELSRESRRRQQETENLTVGRLRRRIASYYGLEEAYVEIQVIEGEG